MPADAYTHQQGPDHHSQGNPGWLGHEIRRPDDLHVDARRHRRHARKKRERYRTCRQAAQEGAQAGSRRATVALMLGIDTNVLVRFPGLKDDEAQFDKARN